MRTITYLGLGVVLFLSSMAFGQKNPCWPNSHQEKTCMACAIYCNEVKLHLNHPPSQETGEKIAEMLISIREQHDLRTFCQAAYYVSTDTDSHVGNDCKVTNKKLFQAAVAIVNSQDWRQKKIPADKSYCSLGDIPNSDGANPKYQGEQIKADGVQFYLCPKHAREEDSMVAPPATT